MIFSFTYFIYGYYLAWFILGLFAATWIYKDACDLPALFLNSKPMWWALATIVFGPAFVVPVYWLIHHSTISNRLDENNEKI